MPSSRWPSHTTRPGSRRRRSIAKSGSGTPAAANCPQTLGYRQGFSTYLSFDTTGLVIFIPSSKKLLPLVHNQSQTGYRVRYSSKIRKIYCVGLTPDGDLMISDSESLVYGMYHQITGRWCQPERSASRPPPRFSSSVQLALPLLSRL